MNISGSSYITKLAAKITWDISGTAPAILIENLSEGPNLAGCTFWFVAEAPGEIPIHEGTESSPDETGVWTDATLNDTWPKAFGNILFSGAPYSFKLYAKDGDGNIYYTTQLATICRPAGNNPKNSTNAYGLATVRIEVKCAEAGVFFQDTTNATYQGITGTLGSSVLRMYYPPDETGNVPDPFVAAHFSSAQAPIWYSSDGYQFQASSIYDYDMGDDVHIRIKYQSFNPVNGSPTILFPVLCNINLCALFCEVDKLTRSIIDGNCADAQEAQIKLNKINPKLFLILMGIQQPLCGVDVPALIEEVKLIGGFTCDCCNAPTGIIPTSSSVIDGYNFSVVTECGDTTGVFEKSGNNITLTLSGVTYTFKMCDNSPAETTAFNFTKNVEDCLATVCLNVDISQLSYDILNTIKGDAALVNLFNSIVVGGNGDFKLIVDGKCIFGSGTSYDYEFTLDNIPANTTFALLSGIQVDATTNNYNYAFNMTTLAALQAYLNTLGFGTFVVTATGANQVTITSTANTTNINALLYTPDSSSGSLVIADMTKTASGFTPISANEVVQKIINYLCNLDDSQVETSEEYTICYIDPIDGESKTEVVAAGEALSTFITALLARGCQTIEYITAINASTCASMKTLFPSSKATMQENDYFLGTKAGECARVVPVEAFLAMLTQGINNAPVLEAFCAMVNLCRGNVVCTAYSQFSAELVAYDTDCPMIVAVKAATSDMGIDVYFAKFANTPTGNQSIQVEISPTGANTWVIVDNTVDVLPSGEFVSTVNPSVDSGSSYDIRVANTCDSPLNYAYIYNVLAG